MILDYIEKVTRAVSDWLGLSVPKNKVEHTQYRVCLYDDQGYCETDGIKCDMNPHCYTREEDYNG